MAARTASVSGNWNDTATWGGASFPVAGDTVTINAGITVTVNVASACASVVVNAGAAAGITMNNTLTLTAGLTLQSNTVISGASALTLTASQTLTSNTCVIACPVTVIGGSIILTLADNANCSGLVTLGNATAQTVTGAFTFTMSGGFSMTTKLVNNLTKIILTGGTLTGSSVATSTITGSGILEFGGAVTLAATSLNISINITVTVNSIGGTGRLFFNNSITITGAMTVPNLRWDTTLTLTLSGTLTVTGILDAATSGIALTLAGGQATVVGTISTPNAGSWTYNRDPTGTFSLTTFSHIRDASTIIFTGALGLSVTTFTLRGAATTFTFPSSQTLTITGTFTCDGDISVGSSITAGTPGVAFTLALGASLVTSMYTAYTDVSATGQTIYNAFGGTLTNTSGIVNKPTNVSVHGEDPGSSHVVNGTAYVIDGAPLTGAWVVGKNPSGFQN